MIDVVIGAGQGGCRIAKMFSEEFGVPVGYLNFARVDFSQLNVPKKQMLLIDAGGTGRNPVIGEKLARKSASKITQFLEEKLPISKNSRVILCVGGGGGSGAGMMFTVIRYLLKKKVDILLLYTLPERSEGLPAKPNSLRSLNKIISRYLESDKITCLVVDNSFCVGRFGTDSVGAETGGYWSNVNRGIVQGLHRFLVLTNLDNWTNYIDVTLGYAALDEQELTRILYMKGGFIDLREFVCSTPDLELAKSAKFRSLVFANLDIGSTKGYIVTVGFPYKMRDDVRVHQFLDIIFKKLQRVTKTTFVLRSSHFNREIDEIRVNVLLSGLVKSHGLKKIVGQTVKDVAKYKDKDKIEELDLSEIELLMSGGKKE